MTSAFAIGNGTRAKGSTRISDEVMRLLPSPQMAMDWTVTIITDGPHPWDQGNPWSKSSDLLNHGSHGFSGWLRGWRWEGRRTEANDSVEVKYRPAAPIEADSQFGWPCSARPSFPAAVAHHGRSCVNASCNALDEFSLG